MTTSTNEIPPVVDAELEPGQVVGEYEVEGRLGQGAFGTVYKAQHPLIGKQVAIKVLGRRFSVDPEMVSRFVAEARAVNQIRHRHIIDIFSFGQLEDGRHYYVMEYLDGEPLDALLEREHRLGLGAALPILRAIAKALDAAHAKGIAHRDLKAENIFLGRDPDGGVFPKLLDFGIAKLMAPEDGLKHKTRTGAPIGTPYYMSPEQCRGRDVDQRTDLYSFGVLTYLLLTGHFPLDGDDYMTILMRQINDAPEPPSAYVPSLSTEIDDAVLWLLQKEPADRPPDLRTAVRALEQAADRAGLAVAIPTSAWDAQSGPEIKVPTRPPGQVRTNPPSGLATAKTTAPLRGALAETGLAETMGLPAGTAEAAPVDAPAASGGRRGLAIAAGGLVIVGGIAAFVLTRHAAPPDPPPVAAPAAAPHDATVAAAPEVVPADAGPVAVAIDAAPAPPKFIIATISGPPDGTEVLAGGATVGVAPGPVQLPTGTAPVVLVFKAPGYVPLSKTLVPDHPQELHVVLKRRPVHHVPRGSAHDPDSILDPFGRKK